MLRTVLAFLIGLIILPLLGGLYFRFGCAPVAIASSPMPFEKGLAHVVFDVRIQKEAPKNSPVQASEESHRAGAHIYRVNCAMCHGLPGQTASPTAKGMYL